MIANVDVRENDDKSLEYLPRDDYGNDISTRRSLVLTGWYVKAMDDVIVYRYGIGTKKSQAIFCMNTQRCVRS